MNIYSDGNITCVFIHLLILKSSWTIMDQRKYVVVVVVVVV